MTILFVMFDQRNRHAELRQQVRSEEEADRVAPGLERQRAPCGSINSGSGLAFR